ncbi:MAG TPA: hypothetical protein VJM75_13115 [Acidimicrobiales bacterium]|nr:hypothetical protein [Acidimicrobiales bacterium]
MGAAGRRRRGGDSIRGVGGRGRAARSDLYFWALQASFIDSAERHCGGGHVGLQWRRHHPGSRAVNWGGYGPD